MSWFINIAGSPHAVAAEIEKDANLSPALKAALKEIATDKPWSGVFDGSEVIHIEGQGHSGTGSSITNLKVSRIKFVQEAPSAPPAADPQSPANPPDGA